MEYRTRICSRLANRAHSGGPGRVANLTLLIASLLVPISASAKDATGENGALAAESPNLTESPLYVRRPLMMLMDDAGIGEGLEALGVNVFGHIEESYTYNPWPRNIPGYGEVNFGRFYDLDANRATLNQIDLTVERLVDPKHFDVGFRMEWLYGSDARFLHSNGLFDWYGPKDPASGLHNNILGPREQFDLLQAYVDVAVPLGNGLRIRLGKFEAFTGGVDPTTTVFMSHSYLFATEPLVFSPGTHGFISGFKGPRPITQTGVLVTYHLNDNLTVDVGASRGWDQSLKDVNSALDFFSRATYRFDDNTAIAVSFWTGPQRLRNNRDFRSLVDVAMKWVFPNVRWSIDADLGYQPNSSFLVYDVDGATPPVTPQHTGPVEYFGIAGYYSVRLNEAVWLNARVETFRDPQGFATGVATDYYEATLGLTATPFPNDRILRNLVFRPEIRYDYAKDRAFANFTRNDQVTLGIDAIFSF